MTPEFFVKFAAAAPAVASCTHVRTHAITWGCLTCIVRTQVRGHPETPREVKLHETSREVLVKLHETSCEVAGEVAGDVAGEVAGEVTVNP